jgi:hypothetical protein
VLPRLADHFAVIFLLYNTLLAMLVFDVFITKSD